MIGYWSQASARKEGLRGLCIDFGLSSRKAININRTSTSLGTPATGVCACLGRRVILGGHFLIRHLGMCPSTTSALNNAVASAMHHAKVCAPRTHGLPVLMRHNPRHLVQMSQVVCCPGRQ